MYIWIPLLYTRNEHHTENQLHFIKKLFFTWEHLDERETIHNTDHPTDARADVTALRDHVGILSLLLYDLPEAVYSDKKGHLWFHPLLCCWGFKIGPQAQEHLWAQSTSQSEVLWQLIGVLLPNP